MIEVEAQGPGYQLGARGCQGARNRLTALHGAFPLRCGLGNFITFPGLLGLGSPVIGKRGYLCHAALYTI